MHIDRHDPSRYCANYCEENIWRLGNALALPKGSAWVVVISNAQRRVAIWHQLGAAHPLDPIVWDYHVVLAAAAAPDWHCFDFDSRLAQPAPIRDYLGASFPVPDRVPPGYRPLFKFIALERYLSEFGSDRSHMHSGEEGWLSPPPAWPAIGTSNTLADMIDMSNQRHGAVRDLAQTLRFFDLQRA